VTILARRSATVFGGFMMGMMLELRLLGMGRVLAALQEERPRNIKHCSGTPEYAIKEAFRIAEVDLIAMAGLVRTHAPLNKRPLHVRLLRV